MCPKMRHYDRILFQEKMIESKEQYPQIANECEKEIVIIMRHLYGIWDITSPRNIFR